MTYALMTPYYGIPLSNNQDEPELSDELMRLRDEDDEDVGFVSMYRQGDDSGGAFGVRAGDSIDECCNHTELYELTIHPAPEIVERFNQIYAALDPNIQDEIKQFGEPRLFYLWSSS
jgi:hypothetical protein